MNTSERTPDRIKLSDITINTHTYATTPTDTFAREIGESLLSGGMFESPILIPYQDESGATKYEVKRGRGRITGLQRAANPLDALWGGTLPTDRPHSYLLEYIPAAKGDVPGFILADPAKNLAEAVKRARDVAEYGANLVRRAVTPADRAVAIEDVMRSQPGMSQAVLGSLIGLSQPAVAMYQKVKKYPALWAALKGGKVDLGACMKLTKGKPEENREAIKAYLAPTDPNAPPAQKPARVAPAWVKDVLQKAHSSVKLKNRVTAGDLEGVLKHIGEALGFPSVKPEEPKEE